MATFSESIRINAPAEAVWAVLADIGSISVWNPGVQASHTLEGGPEGLGAQRRCDLGGKNYLIEDVIEWQPGQALTMRITDTNLPFKSADIRFTLEQAADETEVVVSPDYELKFGAVGKVLNGLFVGRVYRSGMQDLLTGLKKHVEGERAA